MKFKQKNGFTLLELIIVIIIVGVLAGTAIPRFFSLVEYSKAAEAFASISAIRHSIDRCYLYYGNYTSCLPIRTLRFPEEWDNLDIDHPGDSPGANFYYRVMWEREPEAYRIDAWSQTTGFDDIISLTYDPLAAEPVTRTGGGIYSGIK